MINQNRLINLIKEKMLRLQVSVVISGVAKISRDIKTSIYTWYIYTQTYIPLFKYPKLKFLALGKYKVIYISYCILILIILYTILNFI